MEYLGGPDAPAAEIGAWGTLALPDHDAPVRVVVEQIGKFAAQLRIELAESGDGDAHAPREMIGSLRHWVTLSRLRPPTGAASGIAPEPAPEFVPEFVPEPAPEPAQEIEKDGDVTVYASGAALAPSGQGSDDLAFPPEPVQAEPVAPVAPAPGAEPSESVEGSWETFEGKSESVEDSSESVEFVLSPQVAAIDPAPTDQAQPDAMAQIIADLDADEAARPVTLADLRELRELLKEDWADALDDSDTLSDIYGRVARLDHQMSAQQKDTAAALVALIGRQEDATAKLHDLRGTLLQVVTTLQLVLDRVEARPARV